MANEEFGVILTNLLKNKLVKTEEQLAASRATLLTLQKQNEACAQLLQTATQRAADLDSTNEVLRAQLRSTTESQQLTENHLTDARKDIEIMARQAASITAEHQKLLNHVLQIQARKEEELQTLTCRLNKSETESEAYKEWSKNMLQLQHVLVKTRLTKIDKDTEKNQQLVQQTFDVVAEMKKNIAVIANAACHVSGATKRRQLLKLATEIDKLGPLIGDNGVPATSSTLA